jgi:hypothetical protein
MLRITTDENGGLTRFRLEGQPKGDWVRELERWLEHGQECPYRNTIRLSCNALKDLRTIRGSATAHSAIAFVRPEQCNRLNSDSGTFCASVSEDLAFGFGVRSLSTIPRPSSSERIPNSACPHSVRCATCGQSMLQLVVCTLLSHCSAVN